MTDYSPTLQSLIDDAAANGLAIHMPEGSYEIGDIDLKGVSLLGVPGRTIFTLKAGASVMLFDTSTRNILLRDLILDGLNQNGQALNFAANISIQLENIDLCNWIDHVVYFEQATRHVRVIGGMVYDITSADIYSMKGYYGVFSNISFRNCAEHVIRFGRFNVDADMQSGANGIVSNCLFELVGNDAILFELDSRWGLVDGNTFRNTRRAVKCEGYPTLPGTPADAVSRIVVSNNIFVTQINEPGEAIKGLGVKGMVVTGNIINGADQGISVGAQSVVSGNFMEAIATDGIVVDGSDSIVSDNVIVASGYGVKIQSTASRTLISNNNMKNSTQKIYNSGTGTVISNNITV